MKIDRLWLYILVFCNLGQAWANERFRPEGPSDLSPDTKEDRAVKVKGATVAYMNKEALTRDFPFLAKMSDAEISTWILDNFAYISERQQKLNGVRNSAIPVEGENKKIIYRPPNYGRAAVVPGLDREGKSVGMVDLKGIGHARDTDVESQAFMFENSSDDQASVDRIRVKDHSDGLMSFGEAIAETTRQQAAQQLFDLKNAESGSDLQTVETYFVISMPFSILKDKGSAIPAALYGRQAHWGRGIGMSVPPDIYVDNHGGRQRTSTGSAVDFGGVIITDLRLQKQFGVRPGGDAKNPQDSIPWSKGHDVALEYIGGNSYAATQHVKEMLAPIEKEWSETAAMRAEQEKKHGNLTINEISKRLIEPTNGQDQKLVLLEKIAQVGVRNKNLETSLFQLLRDPSSSVRALAITTLHRKYYPESETLWRSELQRLLSDPESTVKLAAMDVIHLMKGVSLELHNQLVGLLDDSDLAVAIRASELIRYTEHPLTLDVLAKMKQLMAKIDPSNREMVRPVFHTLMVVQDHLKISDHEVSRKAMELFFLNKFNDYTLDDMAVTVYSLFRDKGMEDSDWKIIEEGISYNDKNVRYRSYLLGFKLRPNDRELKLKLKKELRDHLKNGSNLSIILPMSQKRGILDGDAGLHTDLVTRLQQSAESDSSRLKIAEALLEQDDVSNEILAKIANLNPGRDSEFKRIQEKIVKELNLRGVSCLGRTFLAI